MPMEAFLYMKNLLSEMDARRKMRRCKVASTPMELSGYCFSPSDASPAFSAACVMYVKEESRRE